MLLVDPVAFAAEPFEAHTPRRGIRKVGDGSSQSRQASVYRRGKEAERAANPAETGGAAG